jgi:hypothetical protein
MGLYKDRYVYCTINEWVFLSFLMFFFCVREYCTVDFLGEGGKNCREDGAGHAFSSGVIVSWRSVCIHPPPSGVYVRGVDLCG